MSKKVLIIDDNKQITDLLKEILEIKGYEAIVANTAEAALEKYKDDDFDNIIVDLTLEKDKEDGLALIEVMKSIKDNSFIISSGYTSDISESEMKRLNIKGFLPKPFVFNDLFKLLET